MRSGRRGHAAERGRARRAVEAWNAGDVDSSMELYAENIKLHPGTYDFPDKRAVGSMHGGSHAATSDLRLDIHETFGDGNGSRSDTRSLESTRAS